MMPERDPILNFDDEQRIRALLAAEAQADGLRAPESVERALVGELRRRKRTGAVRRLAAAGAIAAATLIGLFWMRPAAPEAAPLAVLPAAPPTAVAQVRAPQAAPPVERPAVRHPRPQRVAAPAPRPAAAPAPTEFIPVGTWQALEPMERGSIVRVRMPKSSLPAMGIPVSGDRWNEFIPADVVLGEDGTMRAVRFVNTRQ